MKVTWNSSSSWKGRAEKHPEELLTCGSDTTGHLLLGLRKIPLEERCAEGWCWNRQPAVTSCCYGCHCWPEPFWRVLLELWVTFLACIKENSKRNKSYNDTQIPSSWSSRESSRMGSEACLHRADPRFVFSFNHSGKSYLILGRQYIWIRTGLKINTPKIFLLVLFVCSRVWTSTALPRTIARCAAGGQCQRLAPGGAVPPLRSQRGAAPPWRCQQQILAKGGFCVTVEENPGKRGSETKRGLNVHVQSLILKTVIYPVLQEPKWPRSSNGLEFLSHHFQVSAVMVMVTSCL